MNEKVVKIMRSIEKDKFIFPTLKVFEIGGVTDRTRAKLSAEKLRKLMHKYVVLPENELITKRLSIHAARHTVATLQFQQAFDTAMEKTGKVLNHSLKSNSTLLYTHFKNEEIDFNSYIDEVFYGQSASHVKLDQMLTEGEIKLENYSNYNSTDDKQ